MADDTTFPPFFDSVGRQMEFHEGCPVCEHTDPELEEELQTLAQLLFDAYLLDHGLVNNSQLIEIDNAKRQGRLKKVVNNPQSEG